MIPLSPDVRALIGEFAEKVDNRSLLYEKFSLPKVWGEPDKLDDAGRWSVLRIVTGGSALLLEDAVRRERTASGRNVRPDNAERCRREAKIARRLAVIATPDPDLAKRATENARRLLKDLADSYSGMVVEFEARLGGRLIVNQAGGVVENAGLCLDRCFGLPFLPGSAVKGIARAQAILEIKIAPDAERDRLVRLAMLLFGFGGNDLETKPGKEGDFVFAAGPEAPRAFAASLETKEFKGIASFLPAYPTEPPTLIVDMVNPHHRDYYRMNGQRPPTDDESPRPNYFPAVEVGSAFGFAVVLNRLPSGCQFTSAELLAAIRGWLERAVTSKGAGAKTGAGYGWFLLGGKPPAKPRPAAMSGRPGASPAAAPAAPAASTDPLIDELTRLLKTNANFAVAIPKLAAIADDAELRRVFERAVPEAERRRLRKTHAYWQSFTSGKHGDVGKRILQRLGITLS